MTPVDPHDLWGAAACDPRRPTLARASRCGREIASPARSASPSSLVRLSPGLGAATALRRALESAPEIQREDVTALRAAVNAGRYAVEPDKIAARMVAAAF